MYKTVGAVWRYS